MRGFPALLGGRVRADDCSAGARERRQVVQRSEHLVAGDRRLRAPTAPDKQIDINISTNKGGGKWYANPVWIAIGAVAAIVVLLLVVLAARGGGRRS
jgi:hypothetical protein